MVALLLLLCGSLTAEERIKLTIASSHSTSLPWVGTMPRLIVAQANQRLTALDSEYRIDWREAYGGSLYKYQNTLEAIGIGLTDIGWVGTLWEGSRMPLQNVTYNTPFVADDLVELLEIMNQLHDEMPVLAHAWEQQGQVFLGASGVDTYHLMTNFPVNSVEDLKGRKILAPGPSATWLEGTGAVAVDGGLTTYYTQIQTGVADGVVTIISGAVPYRIHEVAPYLTLVDIGVQYNGGVAINLDTWNRLPVDVRTVIGDLGREYSRAMADEVVGRYESALATLLEEGAIISVLPAEEKQKWINGLPNIAMRWADNTERRGHPGREVLRAFMDAVRDRGGSPLRDWDRE